MLSRAALTFKSGSLITPISNGFFVKRVASTGAVQAQPSNSPAVMPADPPFIPKEGPERDLVNFPRHVQPMYGGKVRMSFVPDEWFQFLYKKTGVTGPYVFGVGLFTYLLSKEWWVIEHEFYSGVSLVMVLYVMAKKFGPAVAKYADQLAAEEEKEINDLKAGAMKTYADAIENEKKYQRYAHTQSLIFDAKRENVLLQLEAEYRRRSMQVYEAFKKRLDYQAKVQESKKSIEQKHMVEWIITNVMKSISPQQEADALKKCITDLKLLSASAH